ncbi:MAG TPA: hypothetical protein VF234_06895 [Limnochordia bacterium]
MIITIQRRLLSLPPGPARRAVACGLLLLVAASLHSPGALAYSYGNPAEEQIAEAYVAFAAALDTDPADFTAAGEILAGIAEEARLHFGEAPVTSVQEALQRRDRDGALAGFQRLLVLNIARRVSNAREQIDDFAQAKILLAKAFSTYDTLSPLVKAADPDADAALRDGFDALLRAIGNPGLFGIGRREPDPVTFERVQNDILARLQSLFDLEEIRVGHFTEAPQAE